ncbi:MAG TPA: hypothetical protein VI168_06355 [Croceibacterium sp.]
MRFAGLVLPLAAACALAPVTVAAQSLIDHSAAVSTRDISASAQARDTMNRFAECIVTERTAAVRRALAEPTHGAVTIGLAKLASDDCIMGGELQMGTALFRGAIYRAMYMRDFGADAPLPPGELMVGASSDPVLVFGDCVATLDPAETRAFVMARPATSVENEAVAKLSASFGRCLAPGNEARFSKTVLQGALAEALYRRSVASAARAELAETN